MTATPPDTPFLLPCAQPTARAARHNIDEGTYALLGAASFLGGSMRLTVCTCVMLLELTNNLALLPLVMMVLLIAKARPGLTRRQ